MSKAQLFTPPEQPHTVLRTISDLIPQSPQARFYPVFLSGKGKTPDLEITIACFPLEEGKSEVVKSRLLTEEARIRFQASPREICGGEKRGTWQVFLQARRFNLSVTLH
jgi:hypothetical protein